MEAPLNKLLTTAFEASLESVAVTLQAKRRQQDNRDSYRAPKSQSHQRVDIVVWMEDNICIIVRVRFYIPLRCWLELFMLYREYISTGENLHFLL